MKNVSRDAKDLIVSAIIDDPDWKVNAPSGFAGEVEYSLDNGQTFVLFPMNSVQLASGPGEVQILSKVPLTSIGNSNVLIKARGFDGVEYSPYVVFPLTSAQTPGTFSNKYSKGKFQNYAVWKWAASCL